MHSPIIQLTRSRSDHDSTNQLPAFHWEDWYAAVGGRTISIDEVNRLQKQIHQEQYPRFDGPIATTQHEFESPANAAAHLKEKALEFGADIVGICEVCGRYRKMFSLFCKALLLLDLFAGLCL